MKNNTEQNVVKACPILFKMYGRPMHETCLSFGFECNEGWHQEIASTCRELEMYNNLIYPKYRVRIQADQIKEKFGTLRFYYSIIVDPNKFITFVRNIFVKISDWFSNTKRFDYKVKRVIDIEPYEYDKEYEITKQEYDDILKNSISKTIIEKDGKYFDIIHCKNYGTYHYEATKHKFAWKVNNFCKLISAKLNAIGIPNNIYTDNAIEFLDRRANTLIRQLEINCESICEFCGKPIGTNWSPKCQTTGWIKYLCEDCAKKGEAEYFKNKKKYFKGKLVKTKKTKETSDKDKMHE